MNEEKIRALIQDEIDNNSAQNQFAVSQVPFHTHNGADAPLISFSNLKNKMFILPYTLFGSSAATAGNYSTFFTAPYPMTITGITEVHTALGTNGSAVTLVVEKLTGTTAPGSGFNTMSTTFNLKGTINTIQTAQLSTVLGNIQIKTGDRLALKLTGTPTSVANVTVTLQISF